MRVIILIVICQLVGSQLFSQALPPRGSTPDNRPKLFSTVGKSQRAAGAAEGQDIHPLLSRLFTTAKEGETFSLPLFSDSISLIVKGKSVKNEHVSVMTFEILNFKNAWLTINRIQEDGNERFSGHAYHPKYSDGLILKNIGERYYIDILSEQQKLITD